MTLRERVDGITRPAPTYPLLALFLLNAVDELDRSAFAVLTPEIKDGLDLTTAQVTGISALVLPVSLLLAVPIGYYADRRNRVRMARRGAMVWATFSAFTGVAGILASYPLLILARLGAATGRVFNDTHRSLLADYYPSESRARVFYAHQFANPLGQFVAPLLAGGLAMVLAWQVPFFILAAPSVVVVIFAARLREPLRGRNERLAAGADAETADIEDDAPGFRETFKFLFAQRTARRIYYSLPFLAASSVGLLQIMNLFYEEEYGVGPGGRGVISALAEPGQAVGMVIGGVLLQRYVAADPGRALRGLGVASLGTALCFVAIALSPWIGIAIGGQFVNAAIQGLLLPGVLAVISLAVPPRMRALGFATGSIWLALGAPIIPFIGAISDRLGYRTAILCFIPVYVLGAFLLASAGRTMNDDIKRVNAETLARAQETRRRRQEAGPLPDEPTIG